VPDSEVNASSGSSQVHYQGSRLDGRTGDATE